MPWFRIDDGFHSHPKVLATSLAARGLWATAGSWSSDHLTDGFVPDHALAPLGGTPELADELVTAGLWRRRKSGYQFHDWLDKNPSRKAVENERKNAAERQRRRRDTVMSRRDSPRDNSVSHTTPTRPDPTNGSVVGPGAGQARARDPNTRYRPDETAASRHPSARPPDVAAREAGIQPGQRPAGDQAIAAIAAQARQAINREPP